MTTSPGPHTPSTAWFLIACDGDLVLKLAHTLMIGEDARGETLISPDREDALLSLTLTDSGRVVMQALAMEWTFSESDGPSVQHLTLEEGQTVRLNFPNSTLLISHDILPRARAIPDREIQLIPTENPTVTLTRLAPVTIDDDELESTVAAAVDADAIDEAAFAASAAVDNDPLLNLQSDIPDETLTTEQAVADLKADASPELMIDAVAIAVAPQTTDTRETRAESEANVDSTPITTGELQAVVSASVVAIEAAPKRRWQGPRQALAAALALAALIAPAFLYFGATDAPGFAFLRSNYLPLDKAAPDAWPEDVGAVTAGVETAPMQTLATAVKAEPAGFALTPMPGAMTSEPSGAVTPTAAAPLAGAPTAEAPPAAMPAAVAPSNATPAADRQAFSLPAIPTPMVQPVRSEAEVFLIASLLAEARALYDAGDIVSPVQANAVDRLTQVLNLDRTNETGLRLMYLCAMKLIEQAQTAYDAGDHYLARNLVEDVLGFHPELEDARTLLDDWRSREIVSRGPNG